MGLTHLAEVFARVLDLAEAEREVIAQVVTAAAELLESGDSEADVELGRFARTAVELDEHFPGDPGVLAALLMNRMGFGRFEGLFLPAGNLHAYLHGIGVEIMANSDNVMRGGLTPKHVDTGELLAILDFTPGVPPLVDVVAESAGVWRYRTPAPEFALWRDRGRSGRCRAAGGRRAAASRWWSRERSRSATGRRPARSPAGPRSSATRGSR